MDILLVIVGIVLIVIIVIMLFFVEKKRLKFNQFCDFNRHFDDLNQHKNPVTAPTLTNEEYIDFSDFQVVTSDKEYIKKINELENKIKSYKEREYNFAKLLDSNDVQKYYDLLDYYNDSEKTFAVIDNILKSNESQERKILLINNAIKNSRRKE